VLYWFNKEQDPNSDFRNEVVGSLKLLSCTVREVDELTFEVLDLAIKGGTRTALRTVAYVSSRAHMRRSEAARVRGEDPAREASLVRGHREGHQEASAEDHHGTEPFVVPLSLGLLLRVRMTGHSPLLTCCSPAIREVRMAEDQERQAPLVRAPEGSTRVVQELEGNFAHLTSSHP
jgi:hypothetical protein